MKQLRVHTQTPHLCRKTIHTTQPTNELQEQPEGSTASRAETKRTASRTQLALQSMCRRPNTRSRNGELRVTSSTADARVDVKVRTCWRENSCRTRGHLPHRRTTGHMCALVKRTHGRKTSDEGLTCH